MACSENPADLALPVPCFVDSGIQFYCDNTWSLNCLCNATFPADPDIAGPGVIIAFIVTAWITVLVAAVVAFAETQQWYERHWGPPPLRAGAGADIPHQHWRLDAATNLLEELRDLQVITGTAILIAGLAQYKTISYYHEQFVANYWWLTLNSFWAARGGSLAREAKQTALDQVLQTMRRLAVFISVVLAITFQVIIIPREWYHWDFSVSRKCYLFHDHSAYAQNWLWVSGLAVYVLAICVSLTRRTEGYLGQFVTMLETGQQKFLDECRDAYRGLKRASSRPSWDHLSVKLAVSCILKFIGLILLLFFTFLYWCFIQFLAVWSYGQGFYAVEVAVYIAFAAWTTWDILDLKLSNRHLVDGPEIAWGFGQVLPLGLLATVMFNVVDAIRKARPREKLDAVTT